MLDFLTARMKTLEYFDETNSATMPPVFKRFSKAQILGQAYSGQNYALKRKCPACSAVILSGLTT